MNPLERPTHTPLAEDRPERSAEELLLNRFFTDYQTTFAAKLAAFAAATESSAKRSAELAVRHEFTNLAETAELLVLTGHAEVVTPFVESFGSSQKAMEAANVPIDPYTPEKAFTLDRVATLSQEPDAAALLAPVSLESAETILDQTMRAKAVYISGIGSRVLQARVLAYVAQTGDVGAVNQVRAKIKPETNDLFRAWSGAGFLFEDFDQLFAPHLSKDAESLAVIRKEYLALCRLADTAMPQLKRFKAMDGTNLVEHELPDYQEFIQAYAEFESRWLGVKLQILKRLDLETLKRI